MGAFTLVVDSAFLNGSVPPVVFLLAWVRVDDSEEGQPGVGVAGRVGDGCVPAVVGVEAGLDVHASRPAQRGWTATATVVTWHI